MRINYIHGNDILFSKVKQRHVPRKGENIWFIPENKRYKVVNIVHCIYRMQEAYVDVYIVPYLSLKQRFLRLFKKPYEFPFEIYKHSVD